MTEVPLLDAYRVELDRRRIEEDRERLPGSLSEFIKSSFHVVKPGRQYKHNWHIEAKCAHLEAVTAGDINRFMCWEPPGMMKSMTVHVFWPVWEWITNPSLRYWCCSHSLDLVWMHCADSRTLLESDWFNDRWGNVFTLTGAGQKEYKNNKGGTRITTAPKSGGVGKHGDRIIIDDLLDASDAESTTRAVLDFTNDWYDATILGRKETDAAEVLIMQRLHECLPPDARIRTPHGTTPISNLSVGDEVLTSQGAQRVAAVASRHHTGPLYSVRTYGHCRPFRATGNHRVLTTDGWVATENLTAGQTLVFPVPGRTTDRPEWPQPKLLKVTRPQGKYTGSRGKTPPRELVQALVDEGRTMAGIAEGLGYSSRGSAQNALLHHGISRPAARVVTDAVFGDTDFWWFVGLWLAEGCVTGKTAVRLTLHIDERGLLDRTVAMLARHGLTASLTTTGNVRQVAITSRQLGEFLSRFGTRANNKRLPAWVDGLAEHQLFALFQGYWQGDGSLAKAQTTLVRCSSASLDLLEGWQRSLLRLGIAASIMVAGKGGPITVRDNAEATAGPSWELRFPLSDAPLLAPYATANQPVRRKLRIENGQLLVPIKSIGSEPYDADVWDIETPCHDFLTGIVTAHNSDIAAHALEVGDWTVLCLPEKYEPGHPFAWKGNNVHPRVQERLWGSGLENGDPRDEDDLLWPAHRDQQASDEYARRLKSFRAAGQLQQRPAAREGLLLKRDWWRFYDPAIRAKEDWKKLPRFSRIVLSVDTPLKDKESSDNVSIQCYGVRGADRYLLDIRLGKMNYNAAKRQIKEMGRWARKQWPTCAHSVLIENAGYGVELIVDLKRELTGVTKINPGTEGNKVARAESASDALESGNVFLPGHGPPWQPAYDETLSPADIAAFIHNCALFPNGQHDDDVDAWSQCMNWLRGRNTQPARWSSALVGRQSVRR